jgi:transposase
MLIRQQEGLTIEETAKRFGVGKMSVLRWSKRLESKTHRNKSCVKIDMKALKEDIQTYQDAYYYERAKRLGVSAAGVFKAMKRLGITFKKNSLSSQGQRRRTAYFLSKDTSLSRS